MERIKEPFLMLWPLYLLVGHTNVVVELLKAGADRTLKMGEMTAVDIARDFDHTDITAVFEE